MFNHFTYLLNSFKPGHI